MLGDDETQICRFGPSGGEPNAFASRDIVGQRVALLQSYASKPRKGTSIVEFEAAFPDNAACRRFLFDLRVAHQATCPKCAKPTSWSADKTKDAYICTRCRYRISLRLGTLFARSPRPLRELYYAVLVCANANSTPSVKVLSRHLGLSDKGAWGFAGKLREHLTNLETGRQIGSSGQPVRAEIVRFKRLYDVGVKGKAMASVLVLSDHFHCVAVVVPMTRPAVLFRIVRQRVLPESVIYSEDQMLMRKLEGYRQRWFPVSLLEGQAKTREQCRRNSEIWTLMAKKAITSNYIRVSRQKLHFYLGEQLFRFNHRGGSIFWPMLELLPDHPYAGNRARPGSGQSVLGF